MAPHPSWSQIKAQLAVLDKSALLELIKALYQLNADNKVFLTSRLTFSQPEALAEPYKRAIQREFNSEGGFPRLNLQSARKALNSFKKASSDPGAIIDMLLYYVEQGVSCTCQYGDIDESFYSSLESAFSEAVKLVYKVNSSEMTETFRPRFERIVASTSGIGWGFHDYLSHVYYTEYPSK